MKGKKLSQSTIQEIKRLKGLNFSKAAVAKSLKLNRETIRKYWDGQPDEKTIHPEWINNIDWNYIKEEVGKKVPRKILYEEQKELANLPSYQAFCQYLRHHGNKDKQPDVVIPQNRKPGESVEVDYSGDSKQIISPSTGEIIDAELFLGSLGFSSHIYAEFTPTQQLEDFIKAHNHMFKWFGGIPLYEVTDNCKTAVSKIHRYDPNINSTFLDMCRHYGIAIDPADPRSPQQKPNVENAVGYIQTDFLARIRNKTYSSLMELNRDLKIWLRKINDLPIQGRGKSRNFFLEKERPYLRPLPQHPYEIHYFKKAKVHPDCHFQHKRNYYSVPYKFVGKEIDLKFNSRMVHAWYNCERVASHPIAKGTYHYTTNTDHYPKNKYVDTDFHLKQMRLKSKSIGENTSILVERLINESKYPLKILRKVQGIIRLEKKFSKDTLDYACGQALYFDRMNYDNIKRFAENFKNDKYRVSPDTPEREKKYSFLQGDKNDGNE